MTLDLLQVEEIVGHLRDLDLQGLLVSFRLLSFEVDSVNGFSKLEEGLILDPS